MYLASQLNIFSKKEIKMIMNKKKNNQKEQLKYKMIERK